jgi:hypothetical protein
MSASSPHHWTASEFEREAKKVLELCGDGELTWKESRRAGGYLESPPYVVRSSTLVASDQLSDTSGADDDDDDPGALSSAAAALVYRYVCHVCYHSSFRVPMLLIDAAEVDGTPLEAAQVLHNLHRTPGSIPLPPHASERDVDTSEETNWQFLTQIEHPQLNRPMFALHPCETAAWMTTILQPAAAAPSQPFEEHAIADLDAELAELAVQGNRAAKHQSSCSGPSPAITTSLIVAAAPLPLLTWLSLVAPIVGWPFSMRKLEQTPAAQ